MTAAGGNMRKKSKKVDIIIVAVLLLAAVAVILALVLPGNTKSGNENAASTAADAGSSGEAHDVYYYAEKNIGVITGSLFESFVKEHYPKAHISYFNSLPDMIQALKSRKIDTFLLGEESAIPLMDEVGGIACLDETVGTFDAGMVFPKTPEADKVRAQMDEYITRIKADGTLDSIIEYWKSDKGRSSSVDLSGLDGKNGTLVCATSSDEMPSSFIVDGKFAGFDPDIVVHFCREYGYKIELVTTNFSGILPGLVAGVYDIAANEVVITDERKESVNFSVPYIQGPVVMIVRAGEVSSRTENRPFSYYAENKKIGVITGGLYEVMIKQRYPDADLYQYNNQADLGAALNAGLIDCFTVPRSTAEDFKKQYNGFTYLNEVFTQIPYGFAFEKSADKEYLRDQMNEFLKKIQNDGTYDGIVSVWFGDDEEKKTVDDSGLTGENGSLKMVTTSTMQPFSYIKNGKNVGLEIDLVTRFCREYGYSLDISSAEFASLIPGITSGMYDIAAGNIMITSERAESVNFSDVYYTADAVAVVKKEETSVALDELNSPDKKVGYGTGTSGMFAVEKYLPDAQHVDFYDSLTGYEALRVGQLDAFVFERKQMQIAINNGLTGVVLLPDNLGENTEVAVGLSRRSSIPDLKGTINKFIAELKADGTLDDMYDRWAIKQNYEMPVIEKSGKPQMKITVGTTGVVEPYSFYKDTELTGYDIEMAERFGAWLNADIEYRIYDYSGIITAAGSGDIDCIFANLNVTDERKESIDFSDSIYIIENAVMVPANPNVPDQSFSWLTDIADSFEKNFIREDRWMMILNGIGTTAVITALSTLFGTVLAFLVCMFRRTGSRLANTISNLYVKLLQGTPMVVLLMILYYVIFGKSGLEAVWVAIIGFSLNFGAYASEIMRSGIESIDVGQREAALALGYSENQAFFRFIFPQAAARFLPVYRQEIVSLLKSTSIVGYIAIQDLTKMSDIIRSRTYEAFFPLIVTAIIYFILAWIISLILKLIINRFDFRRRKRSAAK